MMFSYIQRVLFSRKFYSAREFLLQSTVKFLHSNLRTYILDKVLSDKKLTFLFDVKLYMTHHDSISNDN